MQTRFAIRLKRWREEMSLPQQELADRLHVTQSTVGNWEAGIRTPSAGLMDEIASALGITPSEFYMSTAEAKQHRTMREWAMEMAPTVNPSAGDEVTKGSRPLVEVFSPRQLVGAMS